MFFKTNNPPFWWRADMKKPNKPIICAIFRVPIYTLFWNISNVRGSNDFFCGDGVAYPSNREHAHILFHSTSIRGLSIWRRKKEQDRVH